jgi:hypothetical protein
MEILLNQRIVILNNPPYTRADRDYRAITSLPLHCPAQVPSTDKVTHALNFLHYIYINV